MDSKHQHNFRMEFETPPDAERGFKRFFGWLLAAAAFVVGFRVLFAELAGAALLMGCTTEAQQERVYEFATNIIIHIHAANDAATPQDMGDAVQSDSPGTSASGKVSAAAPILEYRWGGFKGGGAVEDPAAQISDLKITSRGMTYRWAKGGCEALGATSKTDCDHTLACAFYWDEAAQRWVGGKFDWISTSRTSRDWNNVRSGYHGWNADVFFAAKRRAFCIVSKSGKKRTNLITEGK